MKRTYNASYEVNSNEISNASFLASNLKEAKIEAQFHKRTEVSKLTKNVRAIKTVVTSSSPRNVEGGSRKSGFNKI